MGSNLSLSYLDNAGSAGTQRRQGRDYRGSTIDSTADGSDTWWVPLTPAPRFKVELRTEEPASKCKFWSPPKLEVFLCVQCSSSFPIFPFICLLVTSRPSHGASTSRSPGGATPRDYATPGSGKPALFTACEPRVPSTLFGSKLSPLARPSGFGANKERARLPAVSLAPRK